jgi:hypothetical protein
MYDSFVLEIILIVDPSLYIKMMDSHYFYLAVLASTFQLFNIFPRHLSRSYFILSIPAVSSQESSRPAYTT